jgi:hypothetical protein
VVVESQAAGKTHFFNSREEAAAFVSGEQGEMVIRDSNLEDVFIRLTGRRVSEESNAQAHGLQESKQNHNSGAH